MPKLGDIARGTEIGLKSPHKHVWHSCVECGAERWVMLRNGQPQSQRCYPCGRLYVVRTRKVRRGEDHYNWKGGRTVTSWGYIEVWLDPADPLFPMANKDGYVLEHRLVMARHLGRVLSSAEEVHHRDKNKQHNDFSNLELLSKSAHAFRHQDVDYLMRRVAELEVEVERLKGLLDEQAQAT